MRALFERRHQAPRASTPRPSFPIRGNGDDKNQEKVVVARLIDGICDFSGLDKLAQSYLNRDQDKYSKYLNESKILVTRGEQSFDSSELIELTNRFVEILLQALKNIAEVIVLDESSSSISNCCACGGDINPSDQTCPHCDNEVGVASFTIQGNNHGGNDNDNFLAALERYLGTIKNEDLKEINQKILPVITATTVIDKEGVLKVMAERKLTRQIKNITYIYHQVLGTPLPTMRVDDIQLLTSAYRQVSNAYEKIKQRGLTNRTSSLNSTYTMVNLMTRLGIPFDLLDFKEIRTTSTREEHDGLWRQICELLRWR